MAQLLQGRVVVITGAARGIGAATARLFADHGARLVLSDCDEIPLSHTADEIRKHNENVATLVGDVTAPSFNEALIELTTEQFGGVDIVVACAGYPGDSLIQDMTDEQWTAMFDVHVTAAFRLCRSAFRFIGDAALQELAAGGVAKARKIILISSVAAVLGNAGQVNYSAAKAALIGFARSLAREWGIYNVQVNCAAFGFVRTRLIQEEPEADCPKTHPKGLSHETVERAIPQIALGRVGQPHEAAGALLFLASPLSDYVTGQVLEVSGGFIG